MHLKLKLRIHLCMRCEQKYTITLNLPSQRCVSYNNTLTQCSFQHDNLLVLLLAGINISLGTEENPLRVVLLDETDQEFAISTCVGLLSFVRVISKRHSAHDRVGVRSSDLYCRVVARIIHLVNIFHVAGIIWKRESKN